MGGAPTQLEGAALALAAAARPELALAAAAQPELAPPGYGWALLKLLGALLLVCALAYVVLRFLRRQLRAARALGAPSLRVIEHLPLSGRQSLYLVEAAGRCFLLGAGEGSAPAKLAELDPEAVRRAEAESGAARRRSFWEILSRGASTPPASRPPGEGGPR